MLLSQISCHTFLCSSQPTPLWNFLKKTGDMSKELGLFDVISLIIPFYIQRDLFIIVQVTLPTLSHMVPSNFILILKRLPMILFEIVILLTLRVVLGDRPNRPKRIYTVFK